MADHDLIRTVLAAILQNGRKIHAPREHARDSEVSNSNVALLTQANGLQTGDTEEGAMLTKQGAFYLDTWVSTLEELFRSYRDSLKDPEDFYGILRAEIGFAAAQLAEDPMVYEHEVLSTGQVRIKNRTGPFGFLYNQMVTDNKHIKPNAISFGTFTAKADNVGTLSVTSMTGKTHTPSGKITIICTSGDVTAPKFSVKNTFSDPAADGTPEMEGEEDLQAEQSYEDGKTGLTMVLTRPGLAAPTETDPNSLITTPTSGTWVTTPKTGDCDQGKFFYKFTRQATGDTWLIEIFRLSSRGSADKVGGTTVNGTSGTEQNVQILLGSGTILRFDFSKTNANTAMPNANDTKSDVEIDIKSPRENEEWTRTVTNDDASNYGKLLRDQWPGVELPTNAVPAYTDALAAPVSVT